MPVPANAHTVSESAGGRGDLARLLGAEPAVFAPAAIPAADSDSSRFQLLGVVAPRQSPSSTKRSSVGVALIAVDGKPPRPYTVGSLLDSDLVLQSVSRRSASIGPAQGPAKQVLELPPPPMPATGTLPSIGSGSPVAPYQLPAESSQGSTPSYDPPLPVDMESSHMDSEGE